MKGNEMLLSLWFSWVWFWRYKVKAQNEVFKRSFKHKHGSSQKKIKEGVVLRSRQVCGFPNHIDLPQNGGLPPLWLDP